MVDIGVYVAAVVEGLDSGTSGVVIEDLTPKVRERMTRYMQEGRTDTIPGDLQGALHGIRHYGDVIVLSFKSSSGCVERSLVCADTLQSYNALGRKLGVPGFAPLSEPPGYRLAFAD